MADGDARLARSGHANGRPSDGAPPDVTRTVGVLPMAYGTPASSDAIEEYYTHIRRGRPPTPQQLSELRGRYEAIGGGSPLLQICEAQAEGIGRALNATGDDRFSVRLGMKHAPPFIEEAVEALIDDGVELAVGLVLAPHRSLLSVDEYIARAKEAARGRIELRFIESWHLLEEYLDLLAERVLRAIASLPRCRSRDLDVIFTAHSLPQRILQWDDPYPTQLRETAEAVADRAGLTHFSIAWQSAGRTPEPWIGPDILSALRAFAEVGSRGVVVCPAGFTSDHLEILYDLDVECRALASQLELPWRRTESLNADETLLKGLAELVQRTAYAPAEDGAWEGAIS